MSGPAPADHFDVVVVGSLNVDLVARAERHPEPGETVAGTDYHEFPGGKGLNQAVAAARSGARVALVGAIGTDAAGEVLRNVVQAEGIDDRWLRSVSAVATGRALITVDAQGENSIVVVPGANESAQWPDVRAPSARVILGQLEVPLATVATAFAAGREQGATTILNPAPALRLPDELLEHCSLIVPNESEVDLLGGAAHLVAAGVDAVVTTLGARGVRVETDSDSRTLAPFPVTPVDTTGAGDAFCGGLAARLADGDDLDAALRWASAAGALTTTEVGAVPSLPRRARIEALLAG